MKTKYITPMLALLSAISVTLIQAQTVFSDSFASGTAADASYYRFGTTDTTLAVNSGQLEFNYGASATSRSGVIKSFTEQVLNNTGDSLTFSFTLNNRSLASSENHAFRYAIGNLGNPTAVTGIPVTGDLASASPLASGTRIMYQFSSTTTGSAGFAALVNGSTSPVHNGSGTALGALTGDFFSQSSTDPFTIALTFERTATGLDITKNFGGTITSGSILDADANYIFNNIAFSMNNPGNLNFALDNVSVTFTPVPEPSTYALILGSALLGFVLVKKLRQKKRTQK